MRDTALRYGVLGYRIFPVWPGRKEPPLVRRWQYLATTDPAQIELFWQKCPRANLAICCGQWDRPGRNVVAFDFDKKKGVNGFDTLAELREHYGDLPEGPRNQSPAGSEHWLFEHPGGCEIKTRAGVWPGIDIRADNNGYIIVAPSVREDGCYVWLAGYELDALPLPPLPEPWRKTLAERGVQSGQRRLPRGQDDWIQLIGMRLHDGERTDATVRLGGYLLRIFRRTPRIGLALLLRWNSGHPEPLPEEKVIAVMNSLAKKQAATTRKNRE
jgi:hypothetical protein